MARYRFSNRCEFDSVSGEVNRQGFITRLEPQPAALLALLADRAGEVVTHDEIRRVIRGDATRVTFRERVHDFIKQIRAALGDRAPAPRIVETIPRRGYRLKQDALTGDGGDDEGRGHPGREGTLRTRSPRWLAIACLNSRLCPRHPLRATALTPSPFPA